MKKLESWLILLAIIGLLYLNYRQVVKIKKIEDEISDYTKQIDALNENMEFIFIQWVKHDIELEAIAEQQKNAVYLSPNQQIGI